MSLSSLLLISLLLIPVALELRQKREQSEEHADDPEHFQELVRARVFRWSQLFLLEPLRERQGPAHRHSARRSALDGIAIPILASRCRESRMNGEQRERSRENQDY